MFSEDLDKVLEKQTKRLKVLRGIYFITDGVTDEIIELYNYPQIIDIQGADLIRILEYLEREGLIESHGHLSHCLSSGSSPDVKITHQGVIEIEAAITKPHQRTEHFVEQVIMNFFEKVGAVQTGENIATVSQNNN